MGVSMTKEEQIEDMAKVIYRRFHATADVTSRDLAKAVYMVGYCKQGVGEWIDNRCSACGMTPLGDETWTDHGITPPRFELFMNFCPSCGARMRSIRYSN